jgi:hypothetical protein
MSLGCPNSRAFSLLDALGVATKAIPTEMYLLVNEEITKRYAELLVKPVNLYVVALAETFLTDFQEPLVAVIW